MTDSGTPLQSQMVQFLVGGAKHGRGYVLLHPDHLTTVVSPADIVGYLGGPMVFVGFSVPLFHVIGWLGVAIAALMGRQSGGAYNKWQAIRNAAAGGDGVTVIPLDLITGVRTTKSQGFGGSWGFQTLVVTTADGTEYGFRGKLDNWQTYLAGALAARGRDVRAMPDGMTITSWKACGEG